MAAMVPAMARSISHRSDGAEEVGCGDSICCGVPVEVIAVVLD